MSLNTTIDLAEFLRIKKEVPDITVVGSDRTNETVATIAEGNTEYYLDYGMVLSNSYTFYANGTALVEDTDYSFLPDLGKITLLSGKDTEFDTQSLTAEYAHLNVGDHLKITDAELQDALDRAFSEVKKRTSTVFVDGTTATPGYVVVTEEKHTGLGENRTRYFLDRYPLSDVKTQLNGAVSSGDTTLTVDSTDGFPASGVLSVGTDKISYTGKTDTTFTGVTGVGQNHSNNTYVYPYVIELSITGEGSEPVWQVQEIGVDCDIDLQTGRVYIYNPYYSDSGLLAEMPPYQVPNRLRATYIYGRNTIPEEIKRAELMLAAMEIETTKLRSYIINGVEYTTTTEKIDQQWINDTLQGYKSIKVSRT